MEKKKIFFVTFPATGHINVMLSLAHELVHYQNVYVVFYSTELFRKQIEKTGAEYRCFKTKSPILVNQKLNNGKSNIVMKIMKYVLDATGEIGFQIACDIDSDRPDLILHDQVAIYAKLAVRIVNENYEKTKMGIKNCMLKPKGYSCPTLMYYTTFASQNGIYPNEIERKLMIRASLRFTLSMLFDFFVIFFKQFFICRKYGVNFYRIVHEALKPSEDELKLVFVQPDLHPRSHLFNKSFRFVGYTINSNIHHDGLLNEYTTELNDLLHEFPIINPLNDIFLCKSNKKLIFASLGTVFQREYEIYEKIIQAFNSFDEEPAIYSKKLKIDQIKVIISTGINSYNQLKDKIESENLFKHKNIIIVPSAPQIEILKRASLFITHCGMNSSSEAVEFGVPLVCLPLTVDQPIVSYRLTKELGFGVELSFINLKYESLRSTIHHVLSDMSYHKRILRYSRLSQEYRGEKLAAEEILSFITKSNNL